MLPRPINESKDTQKSKKPFWATYFDRFHKAAFFSSIGKVPDEKIEKSTRKHFSLTEHKAATLIQRKWKQILQDENTLFPVTESKKHAPDARYFLHKQKIKKSLNLVKRKQLLQALDKADWENSIFKDAHLAELSMSLYLNREIKQHQCVTILDRIAIHKDFKPIATYPILDEMGKLSKIAKEKLIPLLNAKHYFKKLNEDEFCSYVAGLPKAEQFFYLTDLGHYADRKEHELADVLACNGVLHMQYAIQHSDAIVHLTTGVRHAVDIVRFGADQHVPSLSALGTFSREDIELGVRNGFRPRVTIYPGTKSFGDIHGYKDVNSLEAEVHDDYHAGVLSAIPRPIRQALLKFVTVARENFTCLQPHSTGLFWSKEIWDWVDGDFIKCLQMGSHVNKEDELNVLQMTGLLCDTLERGAVSRMSRGGYLITNLDGDNFLTPVGAAIFLDMLKNKKTWQEIGIDPKHFKGVFKVVYDEISIYYEKLKNRTSQVEIFNCQMLIALSYLNKENLFDSYLAWINDFSNKLTFSKIFKDQEYSLTASKIPLCENMIYSFFYEKVLASNNDMLLYAKLAALKFPVQPKQESEFKFRI